MLSIIKTRVKRGLSVGSVTSGLISLRINTSAGGSSTLSSRIEIVTQATSPLCTLSDGLNTAKSLNNLISPASGECVCVCVCV